MMKGSIKLLSILLLLQLLLSGIIWRTDSRGVQAQEAPLVGNMDEVTRIRLEDPEEGTLELDRNGDNWMIKEAEKGEIEADGDQVQRLLQRIEALKRDYPVAGSSAARTRFKVDEAQFNRKLSLERKSGTPVTLLVGSSPAMGESHVRLADEDTIYRVELPLHELAVDSERWVKPEPPRKDDVADTGPEDGADEADRAAPLSEH